MAANAARLDELRVAWRLAEATELGLAAVVQAPDDVPLNVALGRILLVTHCYEAAEEILAKARSLAPDDGSCVAWNIAALGRLRRYQDGLNLAATVDEPIVHVAAARLLLDAGRPDEALAQLRETAEEAPGDPRVHRWLVAGLVAAGRWQEADRLTRLWVRDHDDLPSAHLTRGCCLLSAGAFDHAYDSFERVLAIDPRHHEGLQLATGALRQAGRLDEAERLAGFAVERFPGSPALHTEYALVSADRTRWDEALAHVADALVHDNRDPGALVARIDIMRQSRRLAAAAAEVETALKHWPDDADVHFANAAVKEAEGDLDGAFGACESALRLAQRPPAVHKISSLALRLDRSDRLDQGIRLAEHARGRWPDDPDLLLMLARMYAMRGDLDAAREHCDAVLHEVPRDVTATTLMISLLERSGESRQAVKMAMAVARDFPEEVTLHVIVAQILAVAGQETEALRSCETAIETEPANLAAWQVKLDIYSRTRRPQETIAVAERSVAIAGEHPCLLLVLARAHRELREHRRALTCCDRATAIDPSAPGVSLLRIRLLHEVREFEDAEEAARSAVSTSPDDIDLWLALARVLRGLARFGEALDCVGPALELDPGRLDVLSERIELLCELRRFDEAEREARTSVAGQPGDPVRRLILAKVFDARGHFNDALDQCDSALDGDREYVPALAWRVRVLHRLRRFDDAQTAACDAVDQWPRNVELHLVRGILHDDRLDFNTALECFNEALRLDPRNTDAYLAKSATYRAMHLWDAAEHALSPLAADESARFGLLAARGWICHDMRRPGDGRQYFEDLLGLARSPEERATAAHGLGWVELCGGRLDEAEAWFRRGLRQSPANSQCTLGLAWTLARTGERAKLEESVRAALGLAERENDPAACVCLGMVYFKRGEMAGARHWLERAVKIDDVRGSHSDLGAFYATTEFDRDLAEKQLRIAVDQDPFNATANVELGALLLRSGKERLQEAEKCFRTAARIERSASATIGLARCRSLADDCSGAEAVLEHALVGDLPDRWRVRLALTEHLVERARSEVRPDLYSAAHDEAVRAVRETSGTQADACFAAGLTSLLMSLEGRHSVGRYSLQRKAAEYFKAAVKREPNHSRARRGLTLAQAERKVGKSAYRDNLLITAIGAAVIIFGFAAAWWKHFSATETAVALSIGAGMLVFSQLSPRELTRLEAFGLIKAEIGIDPGIVPAGPVGDLASGPANIELAAGPTGQLPRRVSTGGGR